MHFSGDVSLANAKVRGSVQYFILMSQLNVSVTGKHRLKVSKVLRRLFSLVWRELSRRICDKVKDSSLRLIVTIIISQIALRCLAPFRTEYLCLFAS